MLLLQGLGPLSARDFKPCASEERPRTSWESAGVRAEELPTACIAPGMTARAAAMKAETNQLRAAVWKKRKRDEKGSDSILLIKVVAEQRAIPVHCRPERVHCRPPGRSKDQSPGWRSLKR